MTINSLARLAWLAVLTILPLSACMSLQPQGNAVPMSFDQARSLAGGDDMLASPPTLRWGGTIVDVVNGEQGSTLQIVARPLDRAGRPIRNDQSEGRFLAEYADFLDPQIYTAGRDITVLGPLVGTRAGRIGETRYIFPVLRIEALRYWQPRLQPHMNTPYPPGFYSYHDWWWHRFYHDWPYAPPPGSFVRGEVVF